MILGSTVAEIFDCLSGRSRFAALITFCSRSEEADDVASGGFVRPFVFDKLVKFHDPGLNRYREIPPQSAAGGIFRRFSPYNFRLEVDNDVISCVVEDNVAMNVSVKHGDSRPNGFREIRGADFVSNEHDEAYPNSTRRFT